MMREMKNPHLGTGTVPGKKTPGGAGTHTGHTGTRTTQTSLTTYQTHQPTAVRSQGGHCTRYGSRGTPRARNDHNGFISSCKAQLNPVSLRKLLPKGAGRGWIILYPSSCPDSKLSDLPKGAGGGSKLSERSTVSHVIFFTTIHINAERDR